MKEGAHGGGDKDFDLTTHLVSIWQLSLSHPTLRLASPVEPHLFLPDPHGPDSRLARRPKVPCMLLKVASTLSLTSNPDKCVKSSQLRILMPLITSCLVLYLLTIDFSFFFHVVAWRKRVYNMFPNHSCSPGLPALDSWTLDMVDFVFVSQNSHHNLLLVVVSSCCGPVRFLQSLSDLEHYYLIIHLQTVQITSTMHCCLRQ